MEKLPRVSVIIPVWNPGPGIRRCIESLRSQTLEDIEMIFVDDCGADGAMDLVRSAAAEDPRIRIVTNAENMGPGFSRNTGIEAARGEYLSFVDADDYVDAVFLERLYAKAIAGRLDIVKGRICYVKEDGTVADHVELNDRIRKGIQQGMPLFCLFYYEHQSGLYRRAWLLKHGIRYGTSRRAQDTTFLLKACHRAERFDLEDTAEYHFCEHNNSLMHDTNPHTLKRMLHGFQEQMDYIVDDMANEYDVLKNIKSQVYYNLRLCNYLRHQQEDGDACERFIIDLREQVLRCPQLEKLKGESFVVRALCDYGVALSYWPFKLPWETHLIKNYVETIQEWVDFVKRHPECSKAAEKDLLRLFCETEALLSKEIGSNGTNQSRRIGRNISEQAARLPFRCQRKIFEKNPDLPRPLAYNVMVALKRMKNMKQTIRTYIAKIPLAKPLYHAIKEIHGWRVQGQLRKKQPIIRQGSPECFEGLSLKVDWNVTSHCNFRCSYCFHAGHEYKKDFCTLEQAETAVKHLASANRPSYQVSLLGGEPTTHPHLAEIMSFLHEYLGDRLESLAIISNGSFGEKQMESIIKEGDRHLIKIIFSVHLEYMRIERVVELVKRLSNHVQLHVNLMFHPELFAKAQTMVETLCELRKDYPYIFKIVMLRIPPKFDKIDPRYTQEQYDWADNAMQKFRGAALNGAKWTKSYPKTTGWEFLVEKRIGNIVETYERKNLSQLKELTGNVFTGITCCAGTNVIQIGVDGKVRGMVCGLDRPTCNIFEENPFLREDWMHGVFCTRAMCGCNVNYRIPKFKSPTDAQKFIAEKKLEQKKLMRDY